MERVNASSEPIGSPEAKRQPKVLVHFQGCWHVSLNIQGIEYIVGSLEGFLELPFSRKIVYFEDPLGTAKDSDRRRDHVRRNGFAYTEIESILADQTGHMPSPVEVHRRIEEISSRDLDTAIRQHLLPERDVREFFLGKELDRLREKHEYDVRYEAHSKRANESISLLSGQADDLLGQALDFWDQGNFLQALGCMKRAEDILEKRMPLYREGETIEDFRDLIRKFLKDPNGGAIFILYGIDHAPILDALRKRTNQRLPIQFEDVTEGTEYIASFQITLRLRRGENVSDQLYAQHMVEPLFSMAMDKYFRERGRLSVLANNWETIGGTIKKIVCGLSLEQIQQLCEQRTNLFEFIRDHPQAEAIREYLTK